MSFCNHWWNMCHWKHVTSKLFIGTTKNLPTNGVQITLNVDINSMKICNLTYCKSGFSDTLHGVYWLVMYPTYIPIKALSLIITFTVYCCKLIPHHFLYIKNNFSLYQVNCMWNTNIFITTCFHPMIVHGLLNLALPLHKNHYTLLLSKTRTIVHWRIERALCSCQRVSVSQTSLRQRYRHVQLIQLSYIFPLIIITP